MSARARGPRTAAYRDVPALRGEFSAKERRIRERLRAFESVGAGSDRDLFQELSFCLLAVQTKARAADGAVRTLVSDGTLWSGQEAEIARILRRRVRFHRHKAAYIVRARATFLTAEGPGLRATLDRFPSSEAARSWLVAEVDGLGYKEASHFLRNIGRGADLAILDRHILRNLVRHRVVQRVPAALTPRRYLALERRMAAFADVVGVPLAALDLLFWSRETGEIFK